MVLTFSENVRAGSGNIVLTPSGGQGTNTAVTIDVTSNEVVFSSTTVTIDPNNVLVDTGGKTYTVTMGAGTIQDVQGNNYAGLTGTTYTFGVSDSTAPTVDTFSPAHQATGQAKDVTVMLICDCIEIR